MYHILGAIVVFIAGLIFLWTTFYSFKNNSNRLIFIYAMMTLGMAIFSLGYSWELFSKTINSAYLSIKLWKRWSSIWIAYDWTCLVLATFFTVGFPLESNLPGFVVSSTLVLKDTELWIPYFSRFSTWAM